MKLKVEVGENVVDLGAKLDQVLADIKAVCQRQGARLEQIRSERPMSREMFAGMLNFLAKPVGLLVSVAGPKTGTEPPPNPHQAATSAPSARKPPRAPKAKRS